MIGGTEEGGKGQMFRGEGLGGGGGGLRRGIWSACLLAIYIKWMVS